MVASGTLELAVEIEQRQASFPIGSLVEVTYTQRDQLRTYSYLGTVAMRPEDKALMSVVTNKLGGEHIIPLAETYTIKTLKKTRHDFTPATNDTPQKCISTPLRPVDLIFDPLHAEFSIDAAQPVVPSPR